MKKIFKNSSSRRINIFIKKINWGQVLQYSIYANLTRDFNLNYI